jgi:hypothetical protein
MGGAPAYRDPDMGSRDDRQLMEKDGNRWGRRIPKSPVGERRDFVTGWHRQNRNIYLHIVDGMALSQDKVMPGDPQFAAISIGTVTEARR